MFKCNYAFCCRRRPHNVLMATPDYVTPHGMQQKVNPATRNRTRDHLIAAAFYSQMLYQLSYSRLVCFTSGPRRTNRGEECVLAMYPITLPSTAASAYTAARSVATPRHVSGVRAGGTTLEWRCSALLQSEA
jgi:hypothetical protein